MGALERDRSPFLSLASPNLPLWALRRRTADFIPDSRPTDPLRGATAPETDFDTAALTELRFHSHCGRYTPPRYHSRVGTFLFRTEGPYSATSGKSRSVK